MNISKDETIEAFRRLKIRRAEELFSFIVNMRNSDKTKKEKSFKSLLEKTKPIMTLYHNLNESGEDNLYLWKDIFEIDAKARHGHISLTGANIIATHPGFVNKIFLSKNVDFLSEKVFESTEKYFKCPDIKFKAMNKAKYPLPGKHADTIIAFAEAPCVKKDEIVVAGMYSGFELVKETQKEDSWRIVSNATDKNGVKIGEINFWGMIKLK